MYGEGGKGVSREVFRKWDLEIKHKFFDNNGKNTGWLFQLHGVQWGKKSIRVIVMEMGQQVAREIPVIEELVIGNVRFIEDELATWNQDHGD